MGEQHQLRRPVERGLVRALFEYDRRELIPRHLRVRPSGCVGRARGQEACCAPVALEHCVLHHLHVVPGFVHRVDTEEVVRVEAVANVEISALANGEAHPIGLLSTPEHP
jgi:hypothetical protein